MKANKAEEQALISLLNRLYGEICAIEQELNIQVDEKDFRPRIDYFHDAIRAFTSGGGTAARGNRLSVELLAYDISMLRYIQGNPLRKSKETTAFSPSTAVALSGASQAYDAANAKRTLVECYKNYAVLFAALLSDAADYNYYSRVEEGNKEVEDVSSLEQLMKTTARKKDTEINLEALVDQYIDDPDLMRKILQYFKNDKKKLLASEAARKFKEIVDKADREVKTIEQAHLTYVTSQLAVYENAKEVVKKMAMQGLNIVGDFVQNAVSEASRSGRGL